MPKVARHGMYNNVNTPNSRKIIKNYTLENLIDYQDRKIKQYAQKAESVTAPMNNM